VGTVDVGTQPAAGVLENGASERDAARVLAFRLTRDVQGGDSGTSAAIAELLAEAERREWPEVSRVALYATAVAAWAAGDGSMPAAVERLFERCQADGDPVMTALALGLRSARDATGTDPRIAAAADADLARATILLEGADDATIELMSAHTACGVAYGDRWLWELGDEQYAAATAIAEPDGPPGSESVMAAILYNRAEVQVAWACALRQLGDSEGVAERWRTWQAAAEAASTVDMPDRWRLDLASLGVLLSAIAGHDAADESRALLAELAGDKHPMSWPNCYLHLAIALSDAAAGRAGAVQAAEAAIASIDPDDAPDAYDLALHLAAELEARPEDPGGAVAEGTDRRAGGLRYGRRQFGLRWTSRLSSLGSMQTRLQAERLRSEHDLLTRYAHLDDLTGLANRRGLERYLAALGRQGVEEIALLFTDVDEFKDVNDRYGHVAGDAALIRVGRVLQTSIRPADFAVRLGGDEFAVVLAGADLEIAQRRAEEIVSTLGAQPWGEIAAGLDVTVSVGLTTGEPARIPELAARADAALYAAKAAGGCRIVSRLAKDDPLSS
jgi:diguanylate cyclase (GGDEF)-like protein